MEGDSLTSTGLERENLALYPPFSMPTCHCSSPHFCTCSSSKDLMNSPEPMIGLRLGQHKEYEHGSTKTFLSSSSSSPLSVPTKRSRASYHNMQNPCCQVEGCNLDLKLAKDYHRRHRICDTHSKSPKVIVAGMERRFCQQCSRFHDLSEFDDKKRSCRRRLSDHNARRRRVQPESVHLSSAGHSPSLYDGRRQQNVMLNSRHATLNFSGDGLQMDPLRLSSIPRILDQCNSSTNSSMAPDLLSVHSLLSSNAWSMNEMEGIAHGSYRQSESQHLSLFHSNGIGVDVDEARVSVSLLNSQSHHQEFQLFNDSATFYSTRTSL